MFLGCPVAATVVSWLCRLWQAMTGHTPDASVATILAASTPDGHCASDALLLALAFLACGGHHILLRLLSLHLCDEYLSLPKKKKKKMRFFKLGTGSDWQYCIAFGRQPGSLPLPHRVLLLLRHLLRRLILTWQAD